MSRYLIYVDAIDLHTIDDLLSVGVDNYTITEYFTLTEDGKPMIVDKTVCGGYVWENYMANRCANITEEITV
jgi:hypothetical protein